MDEIKKDETEIIDNTKTEIDNDKGGKIEEEKKEREAEEIDTPEEELIDDEVKNYKPEPKTEEEDDSDPEDKARIEKIVDKKFGGTIEGIQKKVEMDSFFAGNPEMNKYRHVVEVYKAHPTYAGVPIKNLVAMVSSKDMMKIGAAKERAAAKVVMETKNPGASNRPSDNEGKIDWSKASKEDFEAQKARVLGH